MNLIVLLSWLILIGPITPITARNVSEYLEETIIHNPTVVLIGLKGAGKSSLANVLLGRSPTFDGRGHKTGCFKVW